MGATSIFPNACGGKCRDLAWLKNTRRMQQSGISYKRVQLLPCLEELERYAAYFDETDELANGDRDIDSYISAIRHCVVSFDFS